VVIFDKTRRGSQLRQKCDGPRSVAGNHRSRTKQVNYES